MDNGFIQISRTLFDNPSYLSAPLSHRNILMILMSKACFKEMIFDDHGNKIILYPGQLCCTIRQIVEWSKTPKTTVERALKRFLSSSILVQKAGQETGHKKSVFTISTEYLLQSSGTRFGPNSGQTRDIKEQSNKAISGSTPTPLKKIKGGGGFFYDCLKEVDVPEYRKIELTQDYTQIRVELAVKYTQHEEYIPTKGVMQTLVWHCKKPVPPEYSSKPKPKWESLALKHNQIYAEACNSGFIRNQELIKDQKMFIWQVNAFVPISLGNSIEVLKKDFEQAEKEFKIAVKNKKAQKTIKLENFA